MLGSQLRGRLKNRWSNCLLTDINASKIENWKVRSRNRAEWEKSNMGVKVRVWLWCHLRWRWDEEEEEEHFFFRFCLDKLFMNSSKAGNTLATYSTSVSNALRTELYLVTSYGRQRSKSIVNTCPRKLNIFDLLKKM